MVDQSGLATALFAYKDSHATYWDSGTLYGVVERGHLSVDPLSNVGVQGLRP